LTPGTSPNYFYIIINNTMMKNNKTFEAAGLAGIAVIFAGAAIVYADFFQQVIQFILSLQISGVYH
jgi:hypothetical protein